MNQYEVVIIGSGFSGLTCAHYLREEGIENICILEKNKSLGGVWSHGGVGSYPGAACDVQSYTYLPFLDETGFIPSKRYVSQTEIADYAELLVDHFDIRKHINFLQKVVGVEYVDFGKWKVEILDLENDAKTEVLANHVVCANGPLSSPRMPEFGGMDKFKGESFHTAEWDQNANLKGKKVGIVGTGASAAQVITSIADEVESLTVFQRTATWAIEREDQPTPPDIIDAFKAGGYSSKLRHVDWKGENPPDPNLPFTFEQLHDKDWNSSVCELLSERIKNDVKDQELAKLLTPDYPFFCKRVLIIDDYFTTFNKENVHLVNDPGGVVAVNEAGLEMSSGDLYELEVIIYATGFDAGLIPFNVVGKNGVTLANKFGASSENNYQMIEPKTLWGLHVNDMPNFYMMVGPQSLNPVTNVTLLCEEQGKYIAKLVSSMKLNNKDEVEPLEEAVENWTDKCNVSSNGKIWLQCNNWYMKGTKDDQSAGRSRSKAMWMESHESYLNHLLGGADGFQDDLLKFS
ncbi:MAG: NAD(P)/FAD-dependent oxidoreductase [SAR86 cluster bacterium]|nr:NAD(P)/FAD-dependent oxidoreductase [SAR86 cluster bacterium]